MIASAEILLISALAFAAVALGWIAGGERLAGWMDHRRERARRFQRQLHLERPPPLSIWGAPLLGALVFLILWLAGTWVAGIVLAYLLFRVLDGAAARAVRARARRFDAQLADALVGMSNGLKAGLSLPQAVAQVARNMPAPIAEEFRQAHDEYELGKTIEQAFEDIAERIESRNFGLAVAAFRVGKERGGNLAEVFERISTSIREIWRLEEHIKTVTTQGRSSARIMSIMPAIFLVLLYLMDPEGMLLLFTDPLGISILTVVFLINVCGHLWIRRILAVDV